MEIRHIYISKDVESKILSKHNVTAREVREVFSNAYAKPKIYRSDRIREAYVGYGRTLSGRYLMVAFFLRKNQAKVITARDLTTKEKRKHGRK